MAEKSGEAPVVIAERELTLRRLRFKIKSDELNIEHSEIRLLELDSEKERVRGGIKSLLLDIEKVQEQIKEIENPKEMKDG